jgi:hypothetical protein
MQIITYVWHLFIDIGYCTVRTIKDAFADKWMVNVAYEVQMECKWLMLECKVWHQWGSVNHWCVPHMLTYFLNIIIHASNGAPKGKNHATLVSTHLNSTLPSPSAVVNNALSVSIMLDWIPVCSYTLPAKHLAMPSSSISAHLMFFFHNLSSI